MDFGTNYTHANCTKEFFLENRGRNSMTIEWARQTKMQRKDKNKQADPKADKSKAASSVADGSVTEKAEEEKDNVIFTIKPEKITLEPKHGYRVQIRASSLLIGEAKEEFHCMVT